MPHLNFNYQRIERTYQGLLAKVARLFAWIYFTQKYFRKTNVFFQSTETSNVLPASTVLFVNHQAQEDSFLLRIFLKQPLRFVMKGRQFKSFRGPLISRIFSWLFSAGGAIPIPNLRDEKVRYFEHIDTLLRQGETIVVYAQGGRRDKNESIRCDPRILRYLECTDHVAFAGIAGTQMPAERTLGRRTLSLYIHGTLDLRQNGIRNLVTAEKITEVMTLARTTAQHLLSQ